MTRVHIPGRLRDFYEGGGAFQAWNWGNGKRDHIDYPDGGELELFEKVEAAKHIRPKLGGWYCVVELTPDGIEAARYWATTLETASVDDAAWGEQYAKSDLRAARKLLAALA